MTRCRSHDGSSPWGGMSGGVGRGELLLHNSSGFSIREGREERRELEDVEWRRVKS